MGLDIYLYRIKKPCLEEGKTYTRQELLNMYRDISTFNEDAIKTAPKAIKDVAVKINVIDKYYSRKKVCKVAGVDVNECKYLALGSECWKADDTHTVNLFIKNKYDTTIGKVMLIDKQIDEVIEERTNVQYAFLRQEIEYQRKGIDDYELLPNNCEYCDDLEVVKGLLDHGLSSRFVESWSNDTLFYAWW